ncbi:MAG TPA: amidohydrolase [Virgibacillus sp.]|nr:amidohydrolase [Virgibacillus sp.]
MNILKDLKDQLITWRRDFHRYPETGFLEMRTASIVASVLDQLGFALDLGKDVMSLEHCMGKPNEAITSNHYEWARNNGAAEMYLDYFKEGYTGIVATWDTNRKGPTIAYRVDMDALDILEADDHDHFPFHEGFRSRQEQKMHACGHDAHTSIGLGLATLIAKNHSRLQGKIKLIFQPAEEGTRGAKSMVEAGVVSDVDYFIASHIGLDVPDKHFVAANNGYLATSKMDITFRGKASHAGANPENGKNALLAAATAVTNMYAVSRHSGGSSRVNVGEMHAGSGRNIIPAEAILKVETRGERSDINAYIKERIEAIATGTAAMYELEAEIELVGEGINCDCSDSLARVMQKCAGDVSDIEESVLENNDITGSEDATYFMKEVQDNGGLATYCVFGTELAAGHHNERFDIREDTLFPAVQVLFESAVKLGDRKV